MPGAASVRQRTTAADVQSVTHRPRGRELMHAAGQLARARVDADPAGACEAERARVLFVELERVASARKGVDSCRLRSAIDLRQRTLTVDAWRGHRGLDAEPEIYQVDQTLHHGRNDPPSAARTKSQKRLAIAQHQGRRGRP